MRNKKDEYPESKTILKRNSTSKKREDVVNLSKFSTLLSKTYAWLLVSKLTTRVIICTQSRDNFFTHRFFSSLSHADSSFVGASDVSRLKCIVRTYFWCAWQRPDARGVSKARRLSQALANTEVASCHISTSTQDCWS